MRCVQKRFFFKGNTGCGWWVWGDEMKNIYIAVDGWSKKKVLGLIVL